MTAVHAASLLVRLRLRRFQNLLLSGFRKKARAGTAQKGGGRMLGGLLAPILIFTTLNLSTQIIARLHDKLGNDLPRGATLEATILLVVVWLLTLGSRELAQPEWDLEWLVTLPIGRRTLIALRLIERTVVNPQGLVTLGAFLGVLAWTRGARLGLISVTLALPPLLLAIAAVRTIVDTGLRVRLSPPRLRNLQALISLAGVVLVYVAMSPMSEHSIVIDLVARAPASLRWLPSGLAVRVAMGELWPLALLWSVSLAVAALAVWIVAWQLEGGVVAAGARESGGRGAISRRAGAAPTARRLLTPVQARELRLLSRDRNFFVQTLVLPAVIIGSQLFLGSHGEGVLSAENLAPTRIAALAFGVAAYALMFSAFQTLNAEGQALWILFGVPQSLETTLGQKARMWGVLSLFYPTVICVGWAALRGAPPLGMWGLLFIVFTGIPIFATIATALGVFGCDPLALEVQRRVRPSYLYLYMLLASFYTFSIFAPHLWHKLAVMVLSALTAYGLWQKARDRLPFLLDPTAAPPSQVSLSDGLIAAMVFFVMQALIGYLFGARATDPPMLMLEFVGAGAIAFGSVRLLYWRYHTAGVPRFTGPHLGRAIFWGLGAGSIGAGFAYSYAIWGPHFHFLAPLFQDLPSLPASPLLIPLAVIAAPLFEEFIFRGLIFGGLRRSLGPAISIIASAAIFALVHPPTAIIPVFVMALGAAFVYERTRLLAAPMAAHAVYNLAVTLSLWRS